MKSRQEIKLQAKTNMGKQRATAVLITLAVFVVSFVLGLFGFIPLIGWIISLFSSLLSLVLSVNMSGEYIKIYRGEQASVGEVISKCSVNFLRKVGGMLWMALFAVLWSMLLWVPGIIKMYAYRMAPYILAECPEVNAKEALKLSMRMTNGHKGKLFVADLSFIGWILLSSLTLYILLLFHVGPYMYTTMAGYYAELKKEALEKGVIRPEEFGGSRVEEVRLTGQEN